MFSADINFWFKRKEKNGFFFVTGDVKVTAPITVEDYIKQILRWIGFTVEEQRNSIYNDSIDSFSEIIMFTEKDISNLSTDFAGRHQANGTINFGTHRTKRMKALIHWVQYFYCISENPTIVEINEFMFIEQLETAL